ncbi:MAG: hypothetical protein ACFBZ8_00385 [Opitutales bacterium]
MKTVSVKLDEAILERLEVAAARNGLSVDDFAARQLELVATAAEDRSAQARGAVLELLDRSAQRLSAGSDRTWERADLDER